LKFIVFFVLLLTKLVFLHLIYYKLGAKLLKIFQNSRKNAEKRAKDKRIYSFLSEQWFCTACIGGPDADSFGKGGGYPVCGNGALDVLWLKAVAIENNGKENYRGLRQTVAAGIFMLQAPTWCYLDDDIAASLGRKAVSHPQEMVVMGIL
jgi:hypothetical protein